MSGQEESGSERGPSEARESVSHPMAPDRQEGGYHAAPMYDTRGMMNPMYSMSSSPPVEGGRGQNVAGSPPEYQAPPMARRDGQLVTTATATAVTPDSRQFAPLEMMSPPYSIIRRREHSRGSGPTVMSVSPRKRSSRLGEFDIFRSGLYDLRTC